MVHDPHGRLQRPRALTTTARYGSALPPPLVVTCICERSSTTFAVLLALAQVIAASKVTTTARDFTARDFMFASPASMSAGYQQLSGGICDADHENARFNLDSVRDSLVAQMGLDVPGRSRGTCTAPGSLDTSLI
jgi:hypothetical protein